jgi:hypothetical protein
MSTLPTQAIAPIPPHAHIFQNGCRQHLSFTQNNGHRKELVGGVRIQSGIDNQSTNSNGGNYKTVQYIQRYWTLPPIWNDTDKDNDETIQFLGWKRMTLSAHYRKDNRICSYCNKCRWLPTQLDTRDRLIGHPVRM